MFEERKALLFVCEGASDREVVSLCSEYINWLTGNELKRPPFVFIQTHGDKLTRTCVDKDGNEILYVDDKCLMLIEAAIKEDLSLFLRKKKLTLNDIERVILLTDTDGVFIDPHNIVHTRYEQDEDPSYQSEYILTSKSPKRIKTRNKQKVHNINFILEPSDITLRINGMRRTVPLYLYYMSCNLDHVLVNDRNMSAADKCRSAKHWIEQYGNDFVAFQEFFEEMAPETSHNYEKSWDYISEPQSTKSLSRASNFNLVLDLLKKYADEYLNRGEIK